MALTYEEVRHIAALAKIELKEGEEESLQEQLSSILEYVAQLRECQTEGVEPMPQATPLVNALREDEVKGCDAETRQRLLDNFPDREGDLLKVKAVFSK